MSDITQTWHCPLLPSHFRLLDLGPDIGGLEPEQMHCPGRTGYILESRRSRPETTISNSAIRKARTETETHNRFIDKTSNRVVYFDKQGREADPSPSHHHKMMNRITATSVPISNASWVSARTTLLSLFILETKSSRFIGCTSFPLGCVYVTLEKR